MFEKPINTSAFDEAQDGKQLHAPSWAELVAKLAAAHDLRHSLKQDSHSETGAFTQFHLAREEQINEIAETVNPDALAAGKALEDKDAVADNDPAPGDRET